MRPALLVALGALGGCGDGVTVVTLAARPAVRSVDELLVTVANDGATQTETFAVDGRAFPLTFSVETGGREGELAIRVDALDTDALPVATGYSNLALAEGRVDVDMMLEPNDFTVNTSFAGDQALAFRADAGGRQIAVSGDGVFTIGWSDSCVVVGRCDVFGRRFDAASAPVTTSLAAGTAQFNFNRTNGLIGYEPSLASNDDGTTVAAWSDGGELFAVTIDAAGAGTAASETTLASGTGPTTPAVAVLPDGRFIVSWTEDAPAPGQYLVKAVWLDQNGQPVLNPVSGSPAAYTVSTTILSQSVPPALATFGDGASHAIVWRRGAALRARFYGANGQPRGAADVEIGDFNIDSIGEPQVASLGDALAVVFGRQTVGGDADTGQLILRRVSTTGARTGVDAIVARDVDIRPPAITARPDGAIAVVWQACTDAGDGSACGVRLRLYRPTLAAVGESRLANTTTANTQIEASVAALPDGAFVAAWSDGSMLAPDTDGFGIRARVLYPPYDDATGLGARCTSSAACGEGNVCMPGSDGEVRCFRACGADLSCIDGGSCTTMGAESGCLF